MTELARSERLRLRRLDDGDFAEVARVYRACPSFFRLITGKAEVPDEHVRSDMQDVPPGFPNERKYFLGIHRVDGGELIGVADFLVDWPGPGRGCLGLLLISEPFRSAGYGWEAAMLVECHFVRHHGIRRISLGVESVNGDARRFWRSLGYRATGERFTHEVLGVALDGEGMIKEVGGENAADPAGFELDDPALVSAYDELPLWSAPFGLEILDAVRLRPGLCALDVGCGTGFPLLELAQRLGPRARVWGIDPWRGAARRVREKMALYGVSHAAILQGVAERLPLADGSVDLVVSNNGLNNVRDPDRALAECARVTRTRGQLVLTFNLPATMGEFYAAFEAVLREAGRETEIARLREHVHARRKPPEYVCERLEQAGFRVERMVEREFKMRFADGEALFRHHFIRLAFLGPWREVVDPDARASVFERVQDRLTLRAAARGGLDLTVPFVCLDATRR